MHVLQVPAASVQTSLSLTQLSSARTRAVAAAATVAGTLTATNARDRSRTLLSSFHNILANLQCATAGISSLERRSFLDRFIDLTP
jgi:hypothetical protein